MQTWKRVAGLLLPLVIFAGLGYGGQAPARSQPLPPAVAPPIEGVAGEAPEPVFVPAEGGTGAAAGLKAVAIVGEVGESTDNYKTDMDQAVTALEAHGVAVTKFYYGEWSHNWDDVVAAAQGAHFLLYMGHGVYWGGSPEDPTDVGGFYLGEDAFITPTQIENDLDGVMAENSVVILSHVCYSAGSAFGDPSDLPLGEAQWRVTRYAEPFVTVGFDAYFANNYYNSARNTVNALLGEPPKTAGEAFEAQPWPTYPTGKFPHPVTGYELWMAGETGDWSHAMVADPDYAFSPTPTLGVNPTSVPFTYDARDDTLVPPSETVLIQNLTTSEPLTWSLTTEGSWYSVNRISGTTPSQYSFTVTPQDVTALEPGSYTGAITVTVTDPAETARSPQRVDLSLEVVAPMLGGLPDALSFTYYKEEGLLLPSAHSVTPRNVGSDDALTWTLATEGAWFTVVPTSGVTTEPFVVTPTTFPTLTPTTYSGVITVTVTHPLTTLNSPHVLPVTLQIVGEDPLRVFLPTVLRKFSPPPPPLVHPDDTYYDQQWALEKVNAPLAWRHSRGDDILIAVLDSGADLNHPDLEGKLRTDVDWDYINDDDTAQDDNGHGTHVAGIAAAKTDNGQGVAGLGWNAQVLPLKVLDHNGSGTIASVIEAVDYAVAHDADVINLSLSTDPAVGIWECAQDAPALARAAEDAYDAGALVVVSAGNDDAETRNVIPANCPYVLTVGATDQTDARAVFSPVQASNYGEALDITAPGVEIYSTFWMEGSPGAYDHIDGTSMAAPFVSGLAALVWADHPAYSPDQVATALLDNTVDLGTPAWDGDFGCGRIDAANAVINGASGAAPCNRDWKTGYGPTVARAAASPSPGAYVPGELIVEWRDAGGQGRQVEGVQGERRLTKAAWLLRVAEGQELALARALLEAGLVEYAHPNYLVHGQ